MVFEEGNVLDPNFIGLEVVVIVNGIFIFFGDVLECYGYWIDFVWEKYLEVEFQ